MLYSCTHMATVGVKKLEKKTRDFQQCVGIVLGKSATGKSTSDSITVPTHRHDSDLAFELSSTVLAHELAVRRVSKSMELELVRPRKRLPTVGARVGLGVKRPGVPPRHAVHVKRLVTPWTGVHPSDRIGVAFGVRPQNVDLVEALVAESTHVVLAARVHLAVARQRRVVDEPSVTDLHSRQTTSRSVTRSQDVCTLVSSKPRFSGI